MLLLVTVQLQTAALKVDTTPQPLRQLDVADLLTGVQTTTENTPPHQSVRVPPPKKTCFCFDVKTASALALTSV